MSNYPINASELARRLLHRELVVGDDYPFVQGEVRRLLQELDCPRGGRSYRPLYVVDEAMARRVAEKTGRSLS